MNKRHLTITGLAVGTILLGGCATGTATPAAAPSATSQGAGPITAARENALQPPQAAAMVCSAEAKDNVTKILGLKSPPKTTLSWNGAIYSCNYALPSGSLTMSVHVYAAAPAAQAGALSLAKSLHAAPILGLSNLGLPGYQSDAGTVVFAKDNMALHVDATMLSGTVGVNQVPRTDFAYQMATTILACWSEH
ncbi:hypothetical protein B5P43_31245 [Bacillus sp. SRB_336]|nr:hypothetical protein B5P43_31245 [Bacillus sp. SRB_336]